MIALKFMVFFSTTQLVIHNICRTSTAVGPRYVRNCNSSNYWISHDIILAAVKGGSNLDDQAMKLQTRKPI